MPHHTPPPLLLRPQPSISGWLVPGRKVLNVQVRDSPQQVFMLGLLEHGQHFRGERSPTEDPLKHLRCQPLLQATKRSVPAPHCPPSTHQIHLRAGRACRGLHFPFHGVDPPDYRDKYSTSIPSLHLLNSCSVCAESRHPFGEPCKELHFPAIQSTERSIPAHPSPSSVRSPPNLCAGLVSPLEVYIPQVLTTQPATLNQVTERSASEQFLTANPWPDLVRSAFRIVGCPRTSIPLQLTSIALKHSIQGPSWS